MRKLLALSLFLIITSMTYGQEIPPAQPLTKQDYLQKSKGQKTAAWILLGVGTTLIAIAAPGNVSFDILPILAIGGSAAILGSIPLFISAGKNKKRAMSMTSNFSIQQAPLNNYTRLEKQLFPGISIKLNL